MDNYFDKLNFDFRTNQKILTLISGIDLYKGQWNSLEKQENIYLKELRKIATVESIGSSTRIEGATLSDKDVETLLNDLKITQLKTRDEQEIVGYYDTLEMIYENFDNITLSENYIKQLHQNLLRYSDKDERHRGQYKSLSNKVVANYPDDIQKVIFNTTEERSDPPTRLVSEANQRVERLIERRLVQPVFIRSMKEGKQDPSVHLVDSEMSNLVTWVNEQFKLAEIHPLIIIAHLVYEFLSIHPFQDGNGRLSRLLTTLVLLQQGYAFVQYVSFENLIEQSKKAYYQALMAGQKNRYQADENIAEWVVYFLEKLHLLTQKLDAKYDVFKQTGGYLNERQKAIKAYLQTHQPLKIADLSVAFADINIHTLKKDLQYMKKEQIIQSVGKGKGVVYLVENTTQ